MNKAKNFFGDKKIVKEGLYFRLFIAILILLLYAFLVSLL